MKLLSAVIIATAVTSVTCHVTVFRDGMWQSVPGPRPDRFGPFGPMDGRWRFGLRNPVQFQGLSSRNNMWQNDGFPQVPQIPLTDSSTPTQWFSGDDESQQTDLSDPWTQLRLLQDSGNQGTNNDSASQSLVTSDAWSNLGSQSGNPAQSFVAGNPFFRIPNNNMVVDPFVPVQPNLDITGSLWNGQLQGLSNNGMPLNGNNNGMPFNDMPFNSNNNIMPFDGNNEGVPFNNGGPFIANNGRPFNGMPFNRHNNGIPFNGNSNVMSFNGNNNGIPFNVMPVNGIPFNNINNDLSFNRNNNGLPFNGMPFIRNNNEMPFNVNTNGMPFNGNNNGIPVNGMPVNGMPLNSNNNDVPFNGNNNDVPLSGNDMQGSI